MKKRHQPEKVWKRHQNGGNVVVNHPTFTCSNWAIEALEQDVKYVQS